MRQPSCIGQSGIACASFGGLWRISMQMPSAPSDPVTTHRVGETIDAKRAHLRAQAGELIRPVRGVYVDTMPSRRSRASGLERALS